MKCSDIDLFIKEVSLQKYQHYLLIVPSSFERKKIISHVIKSFIKENPYCLHSFIAEDTPLEKIFEAMDSPSLFGGETVVVVDGIETYNKKDLDKLVSYITKRNIQGSIFFGVAGKKSILSLMRLVEHKGLVLDISSEKIWEKEKRLKVHFIDKCKKVGKDISLQTMEVLLDRVGNNMEEINNQIEKLITYVGDRSAITIDDVVKICGYNHQKTTWQWAEKIVWKESPLNVKLDEIILDSNFFHGFIAALRYQLQLGLKLASFSKSNLRMEEHLSYFPHIPIKILEKKKNMAEKRGCHFFIKALQELFHIDLLSKNNVSCLPLLIDLFRSRLTFLIDYETSSNTST